MAEMINTAIEGAIDVSTTSFDPMAKLAKDVAAGAVLIATLNAVAVGYLVFSNRIAEPLVARARAGARRAGRADDRGARGDRDRRHRRQGVVGPRHAAARRPALGTRRDRVRGVDRGDLHRRPPRALPRLDDRARDGAARRADAHRVRHPLGVRGAARRRCRRACRPSIFQLRHEPSISSRKPTPPRRRRTRRTRATSSARSCARATGASSPASTSRTPPTRSGSAPRRTRSRAAVTAGYRPGDIEAIGITASPCGGCRQWLYEFRIAEVSYRSDDGELRTVDCGRPAPGHLEPPRSEVGIRRRRRAAQRRQVDAGQRAHRREGRDRLARPAHDAPPHPRRAHDRRRAARARRPARLAAADRPR